MTKPRVLVTCPPMLGLFDEFADDFAAHGLDGVAGEVTQTLSEDELIAILPEYDAWIIGDDPASARVIDAVSETLKAAVKWGVGVDNVDFPAFEKAGIPITNTPGVFGNEVADIALTYLIGLARETYRIDREIRSENGWPKPSGISPVGRTAAVVGYGDIGRQTVTRLLACGMNVIVYDPAAPTELPDRVTSAPWPERISEADFLVFTCPLNAATKGMFNADLLPKLKPGVRVVNVGRGPVIQETALLAGLESGTVHSAALDVFEVEPLAPNSPLRSYDRCIFGSHNGSNSADAVRRVSKLAIKLLAERLPS
ncbi:MAG: NAD(P)-dependent oxidoreductase [Pseudomonadota bacterium]